jgi:hypothetical protein
MFNNQGRRVSNDEDVLRQILNQLQYPRDRQMLVPRQNSEPNEYTIFDEDSIRDSEISEYTDGAFEIDINRNRNQIPEGTFGFVFVG